MYILYFYLIFLARYNQAVWLDYFRCILLNLKSLHRYDWIALLDVDEVIVPRKEASWGQMMERVESHHHIILSSSYLVSLSNLCNGGWSFTNIHILNIIIF